MVSTQTLVHQHTRHGIISPGDEPSRLNIWCLYVFGLLEDMENDEISETTLRGFLQVRKQHLLHELTAHVAILDKPELQMS